jgi:hypothetical protein
MDTDSKEHVQMSVQNIGAKTQFAFLSRNDEEMSLKEDFNAVECLKH